MLKSNGTNFRSTRDPRFQRFQDLMRFRVRDILLVSSQYDSFILAEDGSLYESLLDEYIGLGLTQMPNVRHVASAREALELARIPNRFELIITSLRLEDMQATEFVRQVKQVGIETPVVLLTYDSRALAQLDAKDVAQFDKVFVWQGKFAIFLAIIKFIEDRMNIEEDTALVGVQSIILVEDSVKYYSSYLPKIYADLLHHTSRLITEGVNLAHRLLRMRARPKIILCSEFEEALWYFERYHDYVLGVISDIEFPRGGTLDAEAGFLLAKHVRASHYDIPVLLQSHDIENRKRAEEMGVDFLDKDSALLLDELQRYMERHFGFGDFVFRSPNGEVVGSASDLVALEEMLHRVPDEVVAYHGERNDFSTWLKARTEFQLAHELRPVKVGRDISALRNKLITSMRETRQSQQRGSIVDFDRETFDANHSFARIGGGSLGGKARGLAFASSLIYSHGLENDVDGVHILVPPSVVLSTEAFTEFLRKNDLRDLAVTSEDEEEVTQRFLQGSLPLWVENDLAAFIKKVKVPLSVRSSSLLEDSQFMPFAGVYQTYMIPNNGDDMVARLESLFDAIKRVYASTFSRAAKRYIRSTPYRLEEEEMAVVIQKLVGDVHGNRYYPNFSGVARSHNFYPIKPMEAGDGIASVALGLGKQVVDGGATVRFCPKYPRHVVELSSVDDILKYSQREFFALEMPGKEGLPRGKEIRLVTEQLVTAEKDGVLSSVGSTYSKENHAIYDGISREGPRLVTFAPILKNDVFPLATVLERILALGTEGMSSPVEIEFAVNLRDKGPDEFYLLQMRPMVIDQEKADLDMFERDITDTIVTSTSVLGNGAHMDIRDFVVVNARSFNRAESYEAARNIGVLNDSLVREGKPFLLIVVGRLGSADPRLGIPVCWEEITGARVIVEAGMPDIKVTPSQGTHFFQNITAAKVGYITVADSGRGGHVDWDWLAAQPAVREENYARHLRFDHPVHVLMDGHHNRAVVLKPGNGSGNNG